MIYLSWLLLSEFEIHYFADKVFVHRWPKNSPSWSDSLQKKLDLLLNKNSDKKKIIVNSNSIKIKNFEFTCLKKIGISVPFFKEECVMIFEAQFEKVFAHVHITIKSNNFIDIFNELISWKKIFDEWSGILEIFWCYDHFFDIFFSMTNRYCS